MKVHILFIMFSVALLFTAKAQYVTLADPAFATWLNNNGYSGCISGNDLDTTCAAVLQAEYMVTTVDDTTITNLDGVQYFDNLQYISMVAVNLKHIDQLPDNLISLSLTGANVFPLTLPAYFPSNLQSLYIAYYNLDSLPALPVSLSDLSLVFNNLSTLPALPEYLNSLGCYGNSITFLPTPMPANLTYLEVGNNPISALPPLPSGLRTLSIQETNISSVAFWPPSLRSLYIKRCNFSAIPLLPDTLEILDCSETNLTSCPPLPLGLQTFNCSYTPLSAIPTIPSTLTSLKASNAPIGHLPKLPAFMQELEVNTCSLTSMVNFPDSIEYCDIRNNPNLTCLPTLGYIRTFYWNNTGVQCLPNMAAIGNLSSPLISSLPICGMFNNNGCPEYSGISGSVYYDANQNCVRDSGEQAIVNVKVSLLSNGIILGYNYTNSNGNYTFDVSNVGRYQVRIDPSTIPTYSVVCPVNASYYDTLSISDSAVYDRDFGLKCIPGFDLAAWSILSPSIFRPANIANVIISAGDIADYYSTNCAVGVAGTVNVTIIGPASYVSVSNGAMVPSSVSGNVITWNVADFGTLNAQHDFNIIVRTDSFAQIGQQICFTVSIIPTIGDNNHYNNTLTHCFTIVNSYDPNDKTAYPSGNIDTAQEWLTYTVRFQNTGTADAQHIYIMDTLDTDVDEASFQLTAYSHQPNVQINESIVRFNFPNINLPDSNTNEPASHGYVQYKVKLKEGLPLGTSIQNTAYIYFDFNEPVITNTTTNTIALVQDTTGVGIRQVASDISLNIYPNPANTNLTIATNHSGNAIAIYNAQGSLVMKQTMQGTAETLSIAELAGGVYYVEVSSTQGTARKKFIKL